MPMALLDTIRTPRDLRSLRVDQLGELAQEIRSVICERVMRGGGHLAPNLGVVELTIALHYVFDFGHDRLLFDVGHQCYPHKILTGRLDGFDALRTSAGVAGFPEPNESEYDLFRVGHAGTAISTAVGLARGDTLRGEGFDPSGRPDGRRVVSVVGDASIVNGVAMEGLNNAGTLERQFLVVLNDNGMSISKPQGAMADSFDRMRMSRSYRGFKSSARRWLDRFPGGGLLGRAYHNASEATKQWLPDAGERSWFEHFGLVAVGPIDGHNLPELIGFLREAREYPRPMVLHAKTIKGKGYEFSEGDATTFHSPPSFKMDGCRVEIPSRKRSFTQAFGDAIVGLMERDESVVACTAAMPDGTGLSGCMRRFPERTWDSGICESHAMDMMAGLARSGMRPFFAVYSTFLQRAFDQAFQEVSLQGLGVRLCLDRAGLVGGDGAVHHGFCDVAILRTLPGAVLMAAIDEASLIEALEFMRTHEDGLSAVRYPRDAVSDRFGGIPCPAFELGRARMLRAGGEGIDPLADPIDCAVLAFGTPAVDAVEAAESLDGVARVAVFDARFAKPLDEDLVRDLLTRGIAIVTVEDHSVVGGFGASVLEFAAREGLDASRVRVCGIPDDFIHQDPRGVQLRQAGLDADGIERVIRDALASTGRMRVGTDLAPERS
ncbi:MAG: 1-deoxy-D-xylulose-5-phosphate synthase [Phycisphaerales bacterium JB043]